MNEQINIERKKGSREERKKERKKEGRKERKKEREKERKKERKKDQEKASVLQKTFLKCSPIKYFKNCQRKGGGVWAPWALLQS